MMRVLPPLLLAILVAVMAWWLLREPDEAGLQPLSDFRPALVPPIDQSADSPRPGVPALRASEGEVTVSRVAPLVHEPWPHDDDLLARQRLAGVVLCAADERPIGMVSIQALVVDPRTREPALGEVVHSDVDGRFEFQASTVALRPYSLWISWRDSWALDRRDGRPERPMLEDYTTAVHDATASYSLELADAGTPLDALVVRLQPGWSAHGRLVDATGRALEGARVLSGRSAVVESDEAGMFSISGPKVRARLRLVITRDPKVIDLMPAIPGFIASYVQREIEFDTAGQVLNLGTIVVPDPEDLDTPKR